MENSVSSEVLAVEAYSFVDLLPFLEFSTHAYAPVRTTHFHINVHPPSSSKRPHNPLPTISALRDRRREPPFEHSVSPRLAHVNIVIPTPASALGDTAVVSSGVWQALKNDSSRSLQKPLSRHDDVSALLGELKALDITPSLPVGPTPSRKSPSRASDPSPSSSTRQSRVSSRASSASPSRWRPSQSSTPTSLMQRILEIESQRRIPGVKTSEMRSLLRADQSRRVSGDLFRSESSLLAPARANDVEATHYITKSANNIRSIFSKPTMPIATSPRDVISIPLRAVPTELSRAITRAAESPEPMIVAAINGGVAAFRPKDAARRDRAGKTLRRGIRELELR
jgi:hypothetical protein